jgi:hypothetical protein
MQEIQNRIKGTVVSEFFKDFTPKESNKLANSVTIPSTKKTMSKKAKTEKLEDGTEKEKRQINYDIKDESDGDSDS